MRPSCARAAAGKIRHRVRAVGVKPVGHRQRARHIFRRAGGDHIFARGRAVHRFGVGPGVAGGKFQDVRLVAGRCTRPRPAPVRRIARRQGRTRPGHRCPNCSSRFAPRRERRRASGLVAGHRADFVRVVVKDALDEQAGARGDAQTIERAGVRVGFARGGVAGDDARAVRAVAVTIRAVRQRRRNI